LAAGSPAATTDPPAIERPGTVIGPYKLMEQIGEGGMGLVFLAEQQHPVRRRVALKVIKPGMDTRQVVARFEAERQALALMDHVNIAKVLDGGETKRSNLYNAKVNGSAKGDGATDDTAAITAAISAGGNGGTGSPRWPSHRPCGCRPECAEPRRAMLAPTPAASSTFDSALTELRRTGR
jgi:hypothetical protein